MSEEEKKAIETIKNLKDIKWYEHAFDRGTEILDEYEKKDIDIVLNLIEKQQKEIENLKEKNMILEGNKIGQQLAINTLKNNIQEQAINSISKDKIKEKIEKIDNGTYDAKIILQKLLEGENNE